MRWWRRFSGGDTGDPETGVGDDEARRRQHERVSGKLRIRVRCASWPELAELFTGNLSEDGLFIASHEAPPPGEHVQLDLALPSGLTLALTGVVANVVAPADAAARGGPPGMGIRLDPLHGEAHAAFARLLATARSYLPRPANPLPGGRPAPTRPPRPPSIAPTDEVRHSVIMRVVRAADVADDEPAPPPPPATLPPSTARRVRRAPTAGVAIGIDLGLAHTTVAALVGTRIRVLEGDGGARDIPSIVHIAEDGRLIVGEGARPLLLARPDRTIAGPKRLLGGLLADPEVRHYLAERPLTSRALADGHAAIEVDERTYSGVELCAALLGEARARATQALGAPVGQAVVSVPLRWDEGRVDALRRAGEIAGLDIVAVVDEPTAVALANRFDPEFGGIVGVFDLGGSSCDFTVINAGQPDLRVVATAGDATAGSDLIDAVLAQAAAEQFRRRHHIDLQRTPGAWPRLLAACEQAKRALSVQPSANIVVPDVARRGSTGLHLSLTIDGALLGRAAEPLIRRALDHCDRALELAVLDPERLSAIYLSGGGSNLPAMRRALEDHLLRPVRSTVAPEEAIAVGAAMHASRLHFEGRPLP